jgi:PhzF family phenazine biosynthesis protein
MPPPIVDPFRRDLENSECRDRRWRMDQTAIFYKTGETVGGYGGCMDELTAADCAAASDSGPALSRRTFLRLVASALPAASCSVAAIATRSGEQMPGEQIKVVHTRVFAAGRNGGNPCPVVPGADRLSEGEMQTLARRFGLDTAFILRAQVNNADLRIRYFVPDHEMGVSGHATIAAITVALLTTALRSDHLTIETSTGLFKVTWVRRGFGYLVTLEQNPPVFGSVATPEAVARVLNVHPDQILLAQSPIQSVSVSRAKLLVPLQNGQVLNRLTPDFEGLWKLCDTLQVTGLYPFTRHTNKRNVEAEGRQFPLRAGFREDAATGVAAAALGAYLTRYDLGCQTGHHEFRIAQGYAMGAPSLIETIADCADGKVIRTAIRGMARIAREERIRRITMEVH